ncbi:MAG TPA: nitronate monooxygenase [Thermoleophilaceae bacterium]|jgi:NAD(P)H-dependent flavin oxidoreductase YrpB (nitropropane dioxygenase family)
MPTLLERLGVEAPVVQAGMGGGIAQGALAAAVSEAGGLGTLGIMPPPAFAAELAKARQATKRPIAVNILLNLARADHWKAARTADAVVTYWGRPRRRTPGVWLHQVGSVGEASAARIAGADGVIVQGVEAGGHVRGTTPALELLAQVRDALPDGYPLWLAGGIAEAADVRRALDAGAEAAVLGTRFLMSEESSARKAYKQRLMESRETVLTELFGLGWPDAPHRVLWNEATERWLRDDRRGPGWVRTINRVTGPLASRLPPSFQASALRRQSASVPFLSPQPAAEGTPSNLLDAGALYAGECVARIHDIRPAGELVRELAAVG